MKHIIKVLTVMLAIVSIFACTKKDEDKGIDKVACDFNALTVSESETYTFNPPFSDAFTQSSRWLSENAEFLLVYSTGQLVAQSNDTSQASESWNLYNKQMPYNQSWEISVDVDVPLYWNTNGGKDAQVGVGLFVGKPVVSGQSSKVYECNIAAINGGERFVQAQLVANRLGDDPINVQHKVLDQSQDRGNMKIKFCATDKTLSLHFDEVQVGKSQAIDKDGLDNWNLSDNDMMDVGIMGFAEKTNIANTYSPKLTNFKYSIYK